MFGDLTTNSENEPSGIWVQLRKSFKKSKQPMHDVEMCNRRFIVKSKKELSVCVRNAHKSYGTGSNSIKVLDGLNMAVTKGNIYGLLGSSGCGKTTLLNCILGRVHLDSGQIWALGGTPGTKSSSIPGPSVGYMPQVTAIYGEFTASETMYYYGWVAGMSNEKIKERFTNLKALLMLPDSNELVKNFSGGEQRRVSLAAALLHEPELLVLDEPTVGVDPLLRDIIWKHLIDIAHNRDVTIIITTHYIEEAHQANVVGLMRGGYFLAEEPPDMLLTKYDLQTLEDVFLKLSIKQNETHNLGKKVNGKIVAPNETEETTQFNDTSPLDHVPEMPDEVKYVTSVSDYYPKIRKNHMKALIWKGFLWMYRNLPAMFCVIMLPVTQVPIFCLAIGNDPVDLRVAVTNHETNNSLTCNQTISCDSKQLSCIYLSYLEQHALHLVYFDSEEDARESVLRGENYASIIVRRNYSAALNKRLKKWERTKPWDMVHSEIDIFRDVANKHIATQLKVYLFDTFQTFIQDFIESCGANRKSLKLPIDWQSPIYGKQYPYFTDFVIPGLLTILTFFLAVASTAFGMLIERNEGSFERTFVIGISEVELLGAHIICQFFIMAAQMIMSLICAFFIFNMTHNGSLVLVMFNILLTGLLGMCYGLLVSCVCNREQTATYIALGSVLPMMFLGGSAWPVEAIHPLLKPISYILPLTLATDSLRSILQRGWGITSKSVYMGFISMSAWILVFITISIIFLKFKH